MTNIVLKCADRVFRVFMPNHAKTHAWRNGVPPSDALTVHPRMFALMRGVVIPNSVLIKISPFYYLKNGQFNIVEETILNTTPYLATQANKVKLAVVGFNISTEAIEVYSGTEIVFSALTPPPLPVNLPTTFFPSFLVKLRYNTTELFETDITDARFALQELGTGGSGWPFTYIVTVSQTDPDADYSDLQSALTGIDNNGTVVLLDAGTYTGDFTCSHPVAIHGPEQGLAVITGTLTLSYAYGTNVMRNVYITKISGSAVTVVSSATSLSLYNCQISVNGPNNSSTIALYISAGSNLKLYETEIYTAGLANPRCIKKASGASVAVQVWGGYLEGTLEIAAANGSGELLLPKTGSTFSYSGTVYGSYMDGNGNIITIGLLTAKKLKMTDTSPEITNIATTVGSPGSDSYLVTEQGIREALSLLDGTTVSKLYESDGGATALEADTSGNMTIQGTRVIKGASSNFPNLGTTTLAEKLGNVYLGTSKDIYPANDTAGLYDTFINQTFAPLEHWRGGADEQSWTYASYTGFSTPPVISYALPSWIQLRDDGTVFKFFKYRSYVNAQTTIATLMYLDGYTVGGVMVDDGVNNADGNGANNFVRLVFDKSSAETALPVLKFEVRQGGASVTTITLQTFTLDRLIGCALIYGIGTRWTSWSAYAYLIWNGGVTFLYNLFGMSFTPARHGIYGRTSNAGRGIFFHWFDE